MIDPFPTTNRPPLVKITYRVNLSAMSLCRRFTFLPLSPLWRVYSCLKILVTKTKRASALVTLLAVMQQLLSEVPLVLIEVEDTSHVE